MTDPTYTNPLGLVGVPQTTPPMSAEEAAREYTEHVQLNVFAHNFHHNVSNRVGQCEGAVFLSQEEEAAFNAACRRLCRTFSEGIRS